MKWAPLFSLSLVTMFCWSSFAATFVVPPDRELIRTADAIVVASLLDSHVVDEAGALKTISSFSLEEAIKGPLTSSFEVEEPGGILDERAMIIPGVPRFHPGERYVLLLLRTSHGWSVLNIALGKFTFRVDGEGKRVLSRDADEIHGWDRDGTVHRETLRDADLFLRFLRTEGRSGSDSANDPPAPLSERLDARFATDATYTATSYTSSTGGPAALGARWNVFPSAVPFYTVGTEPGAPGDGVTAVQTAFASWNGDANSNVNYAYAGQDTSGAHTSGLHGADGENTIAFERDLSAYGVTPFQCTSSSYGGTLGLGGVTSASGTHSGPNSETFATTLEGDVEMNRGIANCTLLFNSGNWTSAVTHEVGHTLGFRHSDKSRDDSAACAAPLECSSAAIMTALITNGLNGTLAAWDQHAVAAVYPGSGGGTVPGAPSGVVARAVSSTSVLVSWNAVSGATSYQIFRRSPGSPTYTMVGTSSSTSFTDSSVAANTAYLYRVRAVSSAGSSADSASDLATTVMFTDDPLVQRSTKIKAVHLAELRTAVNAVRALAGLPVASFTDSAARGVVVKAVHINELRTALNAAFSSLGLAAPAYSRSIARGVVIQAVDFQEIRNAVK